MILYKYRMLSEKYNLINMDKTSLEKLSKSELINLVLEQMSPKPRKPAPTPEFNDDHKPIPLPKTETSKIEQPEKRTIISQVEHALKGYTKSFDIELRDKKDPLLQLQKSRKAIEYLFNNQLVQTKGFKFVETLQVKFIKYSNDRKIEKNGYFN